ncbi:MAG: diguanylate cyclase, partial [Pseudomonadales bacterium]
PLTGLGNRRLAEQTLNDAVRHVEARGGAVCFLMITVNNYADLLSSYDEKIANELIVAVSERIENLVRPMDVTTYFAPATFGLVLVQPSINQCTAECYQRIFDGVRLKSYKTSVGFQSANIAMSICASHAETGAPDPEKMISVAASNLEMASTKQSIIVEHLADQING